MIKRPLFFTCFVLLVLQGFSQYDRDSIVIERFTSKRSYGQDNLNTILIRINKNITASLKNKILLYTIRQLSPGTFIMDRSSPVLLLANGFYTPYFLNNNLWKLSPEAASVMIRKRKNIFQFTIAYKNNFAKKYLQDNNHGKKIFHLTSQNLLSVYCTFEEIEKVFLHVDDVILIDVNIASPKEELAIGGFDISANKVNVVHARYPLVNGSGQHVSVKENYYDTTDIDIKGRLDPSLFASAVITNHANFMATIIAGAGNSLYYAKGAAWGANISSSAFDQVLPDPSSYYNQNNITVQNHSYGTAIDNNYGLNAAAFDKNSNERPDMLHVFSSGNSGNVAATSGAFAGITGYSNLSGNFKMAKNAIVVGATDSFGIVSSLSSKGPAYDGRIKPEITAFEKNGTSEAAAMVSGAALLLQQYYKTRNGSLLPSAMAKAILVNAADDVNNVGPDYATGFGNLNGLKAMEIVEAGNVHSGSVSQNTVQNFSINIPQHISQVKITLAWNDTAASAFAPSALVNDLDLSLVSTSTNEVWSPWVLSSFPHIDSLHKLPQRKRDSLNNIEQVSLQNPVAGNYQVRIHGFNIPVTSQKFYVAYSFDTTNQFVWNYPTAMDFLETGRENVLRWQNNFPGTGTIEYSIVSSNTWATISVNTDLSKYYTRWEPPDTTARALLRMKIGNGYFYSDTFSIASLPAPKVGFVCSDSVLLYWNRVKGISQYQVYQLGNVYMEPLISVTDIAVLLFKNSLTSKYFSVGTLMPNNVKGPKSYAFDYTAQGTGCYIKSFYVSAKGNIATLNLLLGTTYIINRVAFQKYSNGSFSSIDSFPPAVQTLFIHNFQPLQPGITLFRAKIVLQNGEIIYSDAAPVYYVEPGQYIVLPVPVKRNSNLEILGPVPDGKKFHLYDAMGRLVLQKGIQSVHETINTGNLQPGAYFYRITWFGLKISVGRILVL